MVSMRARSLIVAPRAAVIRAPSRAEVAAPSPRVIGFPGGGLYFFYQAGFVQGLHLLGYNLARGQVHFTGASAGALSATLACANVDMERARDSALRLAEAHRIKENPLGLRGVWGDLLRTWLDDLLPPDAHKLCDQRCHILVTSLSDQPGLPLFRRRVISHHRSREELLEACLASVHIPFFVADQVVTQARGTWCVDGSLFADPCELNHPDGTTPTVVVERASETSINWLQFHPDAASIETLMNSGMEAARQRHERGELRGLL